MCCFRGKLNRLKNVGGGGFAAAVATFVSLISLYKAYSNYSDDSYVVNKNHYVRNVLNIWNTERASLHYEVVYVQLSDACV